MKESLLRLVTEENLKPQVESLLVDLLSSVDLSFSGNNSDALIQGLILQSKARFPELCQIEKTEGLLLRIMFFLKGADLESRRNSDRLLDRSNVESQTASRYNHHSTRGLSSQGIADSFWEAGIRYGKALGKFEAYFDEYYVDRTHHAVFERAEDFVRAFFVETVRHCKALELTALQEVKEATTSSQSTKEVFLVATPADNSKLSIPFKSSTGVNVVIATYVKSTNSYVIAREDLEKTGLVEKLKPAKITNKILDAESYLIPFLKK